MAVADNPVPVETSTEIPVLPTELAPADRVDVSAMTMATGNSAPPVVSYEPLLVRRQITEPTVCPALEFVVCSPVPPLGAVVEMVPRIVCAAAALDPMTLFASATTSWRYAAFPVPRLVNSFENG